MKVTFGSAASALALLVLLIGAPRALADSSVTLLHFSDYHSHAVPFYDAGEGNAGGIARAIRFLEGYAGRSDSLIVSGGDMINRGSPSWSDKYRCLEWKWFNGILDAMAFGNHDADYGPEVFRKCVSQLRFPVLSANTMGADGRALLTSSEGRPYLVVERGGVRIGLFAIAGDDFEKLVRKDLRPQAGAQFTERLAVAREVVRTLRERERVAAIVLLGHEHRDDDVALARAVPGIDLILGSHSHLREELNQIPGTSTWMISPYQYLLYVSRVKLSFRDGRLTGVEGGLVRMSAALPEDRRIKRRVAKLQRELERDPAYSPLFKPIGKSGGEISIEGQNEGEAELGSFVLDVVRNRVQAHAALATSSSFRQPLAPGTITLEKLKASLPYDNAILIYAMTGAEIGRVVEESLRRRGSDLFLQLSGLRVRAAGTRIESIEVVADPLAAESKYVPLDPAQTYKVAASPFLARVAPGYREIFGDGQSIDTGLEIRNEVRKVIESGAEVVGVKERRIVIDP